MKNELNFRELIGPYFSYPIFIILSLIRWELKIRNTVSQQPHVDRKVTLSPALTH